MKKKLKRLNIRFLLILLMFGTLIVRNATAYAQNSIRDSTAICSDSLIHYTDRQDKRCLECLINEPKKDTLIMFNKILIEEQSLELQLLRNNVQTLKRRKKNAFYIGAGVGIFVTTVIALAVGLSK